MIKINRLTRFEEENVERGYFERRILRKEGRKKEEGRDGFNFLNVVLREKE